MKGFRKFGIQVQGVGFLGVRETGMGKISINDVLGLKNRKPVILPGQTMQRWEIPSRLQL